MGYKIITISRQCGSGGHTIGQALAEKLNILFMDTRQWNIELAFDGVHFTEAGHHSFAKHLIDVIPQAN